MFFSLQVHCELFLRRRTIITYASTAFQHGTGYGFAWRSPSTAPERRRSCCMDTLGVLCARHDRADFTLLLLYRLLRPLLFRLDPETSHRLTFRVLRWFH